MLKIEKLKCCVGLFICLIGFFTGEILLDTVYQHGQHWLSQTGSIIVGCTVMSVSLLFIYFFIKKILLLDKKERRRKNCRVVFLDKKPKDSSVP